jgi:hypothetical protein
MTLFTPPHENSKNYYILRSYNLTERINHYIMRKINNIFKIIMLVYLHYKIRNYLKCRQGGSAMLPQPSTDKEYSKFASRTDQGG